MIPPGAFATGRAEVEEEEEVEGIAANVVAVVVVVEGTET